VRDEAKKLIELERKKGKKIGFTSGAFDILHSGHVTYLEEAKKRCDFLVVGVNSDSSIKRYKDPDRPINSENDRLKVVNSLRSVDYAFIFDETNNNKNIEELKPDFYFKAGDYSKSGLSSAPLVESYGGKVELLPFLEGRSTTGIVEKILYGGKTEVKLEAAPILFLDRDGTLIEHIEYLHEPERVKIIDGAFEAVKRFQDVGYRIAIVTNQAGIGLGYFSKEDFFATNRVLFKKCKEIGVRISKIYYSTSGVPHQCNYSKPNPDMILKGLLELNGIKERSIMVGDSLVDIEAGKNAGLKRIVCVGDKRFSEHNDVEYLESLADLNP